MAEDAVALELFIKKVREYPVLYDQDHADYSDKQVRELVWNEIGVHFHSSASLVQRKWQILRGSFRRTHRFMKHVQNDVKDGKVVKKRRIWRHYYQMMFILPHTSELHKSDISFEADYTIPCETDSTAVGTTTVDDGDADSQPANHEWNGIKLESTYEENGDEDEDPAEEKPRECDGLQKFFESMFETVRNFPMRHQRKAKRAIFEAISDIESELEP